MKLPEYITNIESDSGQLRADLLNTLSGQWREVYDQFSRIATPAFDFIAKDGRGGYQIFEFKKTNPGKCVEHFGQRSSCLINSNFDRDFEFVGEKSIYFRDHPTKMSAIDNEVIYNGPRLNYDRFGFQKAQYEKLWSSNHITEELLHLDYGLMQFTQKQPIKDTSLLWFTGISLHDPDDFRENILDRLTGLHEQLIVTEHDVLRGLGARINDHLDLYATTLDEIYLRRAVEQLYSFEDLCGNAISFFEKVRKYFFVKNIGRAKRDLRQFIRDKMSFLFKNMDDESGDSDTLLVINKISLIKKNLHHHAPERNHPVPGKTGKKR